MTAEVFAPAVIGEPGVYDVPAADYFADPVLGGSLSSTGARLLVEDAGPAKYRYAIDNREPFKATFAFGTAAHHKVLGDVDDRIVVVDAPDWRTKIAQVQRDEAHEQGKAPVLRKDWDVVEQMAKAIEEHPEAASLLRAASGRPEQTLVWQDMFGVWCRARVDWLRSVQEGERLILVDYKTCEHADRTRFGKSSADYGYHQQDDFYRRGVIALGLDPDPAFVFVAQEKKPPYLVNVIQLDRTAQVIGMNLNYNALGIYDDCRRSGRWPGYFGIQEVSLPAWYERAHDEDGDRR